MKKQPEVAALSVGNGVCGVAVSVGGLCPPLCGHWTIPFLGRKGVQRSGPTWEKELQLPRERQIEREPIVVMLFAGRVAKPRRSGLCRGRFGGIFQPHFPPPCA